MTNAIMEKEGGSESRDQRIKIWQMSISSRRKELAELKKIRDELRRQTSKLELAIKITNELKKH